MVTVVIYSEPEVDNVIHITWEVLVFFLNSQLLEAEYTWEQQLEQLKHSQPAKHCTPFFLYPQRFVVQPVAHVQPFVRTSTLSDGADVELRVPLHGERIFITAPSK